MCFGWGFQFSRVLVNRRLGCRLLSPIQLCNPEFVEQVTGLLEVEAFDARRLTFEITEGVLISNSDQARRAINALKGVGVKFALDDFGCGFASIGAVRQFGFDRMKIDKSLVWAIDDAKRGADVMDATIALAIALGIPVTAEGIETGRQAEILRAAGCDQLQGYLVGKPMSILELEQLTTPTFLEARSINGLGVPAHRGDDTYGIYRGRQII